MLTVQKLLTITVLAASIAPVSAQSSKDYAAMGFATWAAFECASLAANLKNPTDQERLFFYGYKQGQAFVDAVRAGKIESKDMSADVPFGLALRLEGPTTDFVLGRVFEAAQDNALKEVFGPPGQMNNDALQASIARDRFRKANCSLLGSR